MREREAIGERGELTVRGRDPLTARADRFRERLDQSKLRLQEAVWRVRESAREMTPAARIESNPIAWVVGGLAVGLALGWLSSGRRRSR